MATLDTNIKQVGSDFRAIKNKIISHGVEVADGTSTADYATKVDEIYEAGKASMVDEGKIIEKSATGTDTLFINDISEVPHNMDIKLSSDTITDFSDVDLKICGGNLIPFPYIKDKVITSAGVTFTINDDGSITANGTPTGVFDYIYAIISLPAGTYTYSLGNKNEFTSVVSLRNKTTNVFAQNLGNVSASNRNFTFTLTQAQSETYNVWINLYNVTGTLENETVYPMLNNGSIAFSYEPYYNAEKDPSRNLIPFPYYETTKTKNGLTFTVNNDGTITVNGTATAQTSFRLTEGSTFTLPKGVYSVSGLPTQTSDVLYYIGAGIYDDNTWKAEIVDYRGYGVYKDLTDLTYTNVRVDLTIKEGVVCNNLVFRPMLNYGPTASQYVPYKKLIEMDGTVNTTKHLSPNMSIFAEGVDITANYHKSFGMQTEYDRFWDALQNNGSRTDYYYGFCGYSWTAKTFKPKYDIRGTRFQSTFFTTGIFYGSLIDILNNCGVVLDTSNATQITNMFSYSGLSEIPHIDCSGLTAYSVADMFNQCTRLKKIEKLTLKEGVSFGTNAFNACKELVEVEFAGVLSTNGLNLKSCTKLNKASWISLINTLSSTTTGLTVTGSLTSVDKAFETAEGANDGSSSQEWTDLIAEKTNWTISLV